LAGKNILLEAQMRERGIDVPELCYVSSSSDSDWLAEPRAKISGFFSN